MLVQHDAVYHLYLLGLSRYIYHTWLVSWCSPGSSNKAVTLIFENTESVHLGKWYKLIMGSILVFLYTASVFGIYGDLLSFQWLWKCLLFNVFRIDFEYCYFHYHLCNTNHGGVVNSFLSWPGFDILIEQSQCKLYELGYKLVRKVVLNKTFILTYQNRY